MTSSNARLRLAPADTALSSIATADPAGSRSGQVFGFTPSTRVLWRGPDRLQLELGQERVVVQGLDPSTVSALTHEGAGPGPAQHELFRILHRAGFLSRLGAADPPPAASPESPDRFGPDRLDADQVNAGPLDLTPSPESVTSALLAPDLAALGSRFGDRAPAVLAARRRRRVSMLGGGRLPTLIASLLAAAGVGQVQVADSGDVSLRDVIPGGLTAADEGQRIAAAASKAVNRAVPGARWATGGTQSADLVVLTAGIPVPRPLTTEFAFTAQPHLVVGVWGATAVIGPFVLPGRSSCLECADRQRRDRDPAWPALAAQLEAVRRGREPSDVCVCAMAAAVAAMQCLQFLDGQSVATIDGTLELTLPDWRLRRRSWPVHPDCSCLMAIAS